MKINNLLTKIAFSFTVLIVSYNAFNLGKAIPIKTIDQGLSIESAKIDSIREILVLGLKRGVPHTLDSESDVCIKQMTSMKHMPDLVVFWGLLKRIFDQNSPRPYMTNKEYLEFISKVGEKENLENNTNCEDFFSKNLANDDELQNRGKTARTHIEPLISNKINVEVKGKNFITAFTGVHRFTKESDILIPKLNQKK